VRRVAIDRARLKSWYVAAVFICGTAALVDALRTLNSHPVAPQWIVLAILTLASGTFTVKLPSLNATLSISEAFLLALVLLFGGAPAVITVAIDGLVISLARRHRDLSHAAFNVAEPAVSMWIASRVYAAIGVPPLQTIPNTLTLIDLALPALALGGVYFVLNAALNALAMAIESNTSPLALWRRFYLWVSLNYVGGVSIAVLLALNTHTVTVASLLAAVLLMTPLIFISHYTIKSSMGRLEDENAHLAEIGRLYLRVVETLAMAVDAKDQVTHGHICRVQKIALRLAKVLNVTEDSGLKAIESAALLHDIGKLAVPEHILNKPGRLTPSEYERMKLHAPLGADLLAAVDFPSPVVPIVRHHHENWDGTGYPDGLRGGEIPVGARILSVVDCYDALRSHRPYRRALSPDEAIGVIRERTGTMYDPAVVNAFEGILSEVETRADDEPLPDALDRFARAAREMYGRDAEPEALSLELRLRATDTVLCLFDHLARLGRPASLSDTCDITASYLLRLVPAGLVVFFTRDERSETLSAAYASGFGAALFDDLTIHMGDRVSGWVAANRRSMFNADPAIDLGDRARLLTPALQSELSVPLISGGAVVGSVSLYSVQADAFTDDQCRSVELVIGPVADVVRSLHGLEESATAARSPLTPRTTGVDTLLRCDSFWQPATRGSLGFLYLRSRGDAAAMMHAAVAVHQATRVADLIVRLQEDELVVLMPGADHGAGRAVVDRIADALARMPGGQALCKSLRVGFACGPYDGNSVRELLAAARHRLETSPDGLPPVTTTLPSAAAQGGTS
jgi:putative nucleotidyltransferase with HDIG domain